MKQLGLRTPKDINLRRDDRTLVWDCPACGEETACLPNHNRPQAEWESIAIPEITRDPWCSACARAARNFQEVLS